MTLEELRDNIEDEVLWSMRENMDEEYDEDERGLYRNKDVNRVGEILEDLIDALAEADEEEEEILRAVKNAVKKLNKLNDKLDGALIENVQQDDLISFINEAVNAAGYETDDDLTEEWREW